MCVCTHVFFYDFNSCYMCMHTYIYIPVSIHIYSVGQANWRQQQVEISFVIFRFCSLWCHHQNRLDNRSFRNKYFRSLLLTVYKCKKNSFFHSRNIYAINQQTYTCTNFLIRQNINYRHQSRHENNFAVLSFSLLVNFVCQKSLFYKLRQ